MSPEDHDDRDRAQAMINWLTDKDPDVWFEATGNLNWDSADKVLDWIVSQPACDKANAAQIFWGCDPAYYAGQFLAGEEPRGGYYALAQKILHNWKCGFYTRAELALPAEESGAERYVRMLSGRRDPLALPADLLAPIRGRSPRVPRACRAAENAAVWDLFDALGTHVGARPGTKAWRTQRNPLYLSPAETQARRAAIKSDVANTLRFYARCAPWLALFFVLAMLTAFTLRYLHKGVVF